MLIVLIILIVLAIIVAFLVSDKYYDVMFVTACVGATVIGIGSVIMLMCIISYYIDGYTAKDKISMYQEENKKIEEDINILVNNYMDYENKTLKEFKNENAITLVQLYPELKSDELVKQQIYIYTENNKKIKELKEKTIDLKVGKWLLYFGK